MGSPGQAATAGGGITPLQASLAQYTMAQQGIGTNQAFSQGMGDSTGATQGWAGAQAQGALTASQESQANAAALSALINQNFNQFASGIGSGIGGIGTLLSGGKGGGGGG